jgi:hypothetical protein
MKQMTTDHSLYATHVYEYDDKKTPFHATPGFYSTRMGFIEGRYNNILKETVTFPGVGTPSIYTSSHEYNKDGYPIKTTFVDSGGNVYVTEYTYNCR